ncbi:MAG: hypothetical protein ABH864_07210 [archaeon]
METEQELIDRFANLESLKKTIELDIKDIREILIKLSQDKNQQILYGSKKKCSLKPYDKLIYPENKEQLIQKLKETGDYEKVSGIIYPRLSSKIMKEEVHKEIIAMIKKEKAFRFSLTDK